MEIEVAKLISFVLSFCIVCGFSYWGLQRLNFKNLFAPDSTIQIRVIILLVSVSLGFLCALGFSEIIGLITSIIY